MRENFPWNHAYSVKSSIITPRRAFAERRWPTAAEETGDVKSAPSGLKALLPPSPPATPDGCTSWMTLARRRLICLSLSSQLDAYGLCPFAFRLHDIRDASCNTPWRIQTPLALSSRTFGSCYHRNEATMCLDADDINYGKFSCTKACSVHFHAKIDWLTEKVVPLKHFLMTLRMT